MPLSAVSVVTALVREMVGKR